MLEWVKNETEKDISETTKALDWEIDISRVYEGLEESNIKYRLVSMVKSDTLSQMLCYSFSVFLCYRLIIWKCRLVALLKENTFAWLIRRTGGSVSDMKL